MGSFVRRVKTASGATAVQIVHKRGRRVVGIDHIGSAHDEDQLALLEETAKHRLHAGQQVLDLEMPTSGRTDAETTVVEATSSQILWEALGRLYDALGFTAVRDEAFRALVLGRIVEPTTAPYDLAAHLQRHGNAFDDGQILESSRVMGVGKAARSRRVVYQYKFARHKRDDRAINAMVERAEKVAAGTRPLKKDRFVRIARYRHGRRLGAGRAGSAAGRVEGLRH